MGIVKVKPDAVVQPNTTEPVVAEKPYETQFQTLIPESRVETLKAYVEGYPWTVHFYGQILAEDNIVDSPDDGIPNLLQTYYKIKNLVLRVESPLADNYNQEEGVTRITGSAIFPDSVYPNVGDVLLAQIDNGEDAIFVINTVERLTARKESVYVASYSLLYYASENIAFLSQLEDRVNDLHYYREDPHYSGLGNLVIPSVKEALDRLDYYLKTTTEYYFHKFYNVEYATFLVPGQDFTGYDPVMIRFLSQTTDMYSDPQRRLITRYDYGKNLYIDQPTILDMVAKRNVGLAPTINKRFSFTLTGLLRGHPRFANITYSGIERVLFPLDHEKISQKPPLHGYPHIEETDPTYPVESYAVDYDEGMLPDLSAMTIETIDGHIPHLPQLFDDGYYIVSSRFYDHYLYPEVNAEPPPSFFELLLSRWLKEEAISNKDLVMLTQNFTAWPWIHQFYLLPVIWTMIRTQRV